MAKKVLIVEDNVWNMKLFNDLLETCGYDTVQMCDGHGFLENVRATLPDLVVMDIQLPEISGFELTRLLKSEDRLKNIPVIAVTAFGRSGDEDRLRSAGFDDYLAKPISVRGFLETVGRHLHTVETAH